MTDKELKRLNRAELLQILVDQSIEIDSLRRKLDKAESALAERNLQIAESGTLAEATLRLNRIFADADAAAAQYLENIRRMEAEWIEKTGGEPTEPAPAPDPEAQAQPDSEAEPKTEQTLDAAIESSIPEPKPKKEHKQKRNKSRQKR